MVMHHHDRIMPERVRLHDLTNTLFVGTHTATDKRHRAGWDIIAAFQPSFAFNA